MKTYTDKLDIGPFNEKVKNSFKEIFKRLGWEVKETRDVFNVTYPVDDEYLMDFFIDSMI